jgi:hypothetical protein
MESTHVNKIKAGTFEPFKRSLFLACAVVTSACFAWGVRAAWKQAKPLKPSELSNANLLGGAGFAARALGIATVITVSGFGLLILGVSAAMGVDTPKQFGIKMKGAFGDRYRLKASTSGETYESLSELFEAASSTRKPKVEEVVDSSRK